MPKYNNRFIIGDVETGGLPGKDKPAVASIALTEVSLCSVDNETLDIIGSVSWLIKPYDDNLIYSPQAMQITGLTVDYLIDNGLDIESVFNKIKKYIKDHTIGKTKPILVFHNKGFDMQFFENLFSLFNDDIYKYIDRVECTLEWSRLKYIEKPDFKLGSVAQYNGIDLVDGHRAEKDTIVTAKIWINLIKSLRDNGNSSQKQESVNSFRKSFKF